MSLVRLIKKIISDNNEKEWVKFKLKYEVENKLGPYISALSNGATLAGIKSGYLIFLIDETSTKIKEKGFGPNFNFDNESTLIDTLESNIFPKIKLQLHKINIDNKTIVVIEIPAADKVPTSWKNERYLKVGKTIDNLINFPEKEVELFRIFSARIKTIDNTKSSYQDLSFNKLLIYFYLKEKKLDIKAFKENLGLLTKDGSYNILAQLLSDDSHIPLRVSIFAGTTKASQLLSIKEFGYNCLIYTLDDLLRYGEILNFIQTDERNRVVERKEVPLFDIKLFKEAIINAIVNNKWIDGNEPMISVFSDRIEILSRGNLSPTQTKEAFYNGEFIPSNKKLYDIFSQLNIIDDSTTGVSSIVTKYGNKAIKFNENSIVVTLPFNKIYVVDFIQPRKNFKLNNTQKRILSEIEKDNYITKKELSKKLDRSDVAIDNNIKVLKDEGFIKRKGANKNGYWEVLKS